MNKTYSNTYRMVLSALMIALALILNRIVPATPVYHLSLDFLPIFVIAIMFGPVWAAISYGIMDTLGSIIISYGAYNPGITLSLMLIGLAYGLIFKTRKELSGKKLIARCIAASLAAFLVKLFITTFFLYIMYGGGDTYMAYLITRIPNCLAILIANTILLPMVYRLVHKRIIG